MSECFSLFAFAAKRRHKLLVNYITSDNILCCICQNSAARELNMLQLTQALIVSFNLVKY